MSDLMIFTTNVALGRCQSKGALLLNIFLGATTDMETGIVRRA
jgi:hypothetical protein